MNLFKVHILNDGGIEKAKYLQQVYEDAFAKIEAVIPDDSREKSLFRTKLEESSFYAKKAMAKDPINQRTEEA